MEESHGGYFRACIYDQGETAVRISLDFLIHIKVRLYLLEMLLLE